MRNFGQTIIMPRHVCNSSSRTCRSKRPPFERSKARLNPWRSSRRLPTHPMMQKCMKSCFPKSCRLRNKPRSSPRHSCSPNLRMRMVPTSKSSLDLVGQRHATGLVFLRGCTLAGPKVTTSRVRPFSVPHCISQTH